MSVFKIEKWDVLVFMRKNLFLLAFTVASLFSFSCFAAPRIIVGQFEDVANKSVNIGGRLSAGNTELGNFTTSTAVNFVVHELVNSGKVIVLDRRSSNGNVADFSVIGSITNCAVKVSKLGYTNNNGGAVGNNKYTVCANLTLIVEDYRNKEMLFAVDGNGESSCTGTEVKVADHVLKVGSEKVTDRSIHNAMQKACKVATMRMLQELKKKGRVN